MNPFPPDDTAHSAGSMESPGGRLYLYRFLKQLASHGSGDSDPLALSYDGAKRLASRLELNRPEKLVRLFDDLGLGNLNLEINEGWLKVTLSSLKKPRNADAAVSMTGGCELERGLIDSSLESITDLAVATIETSCRFKGDEFCCFEASREVYNGIHSYKPRAPARTTGEMLAAGKPSRKPIASPADVSDLRAWYLDSVSRELARSRRHSRSLSLLYIDVDNLGDINSSKGREAGDQVINAVAASLGRCLRTEDFLWHHGEDEFIIVLVETKIGCAEVVARRLNTEILSAAEYLDVAATVSASIGFSTFPTHADSLASLLTSARSALYLAKSLGKARSQAAWEDDELNVTTPSRECEQPSDELLEWAAYKPAKRKTDKPIPEQEVEGSAYKEKVEVEEEPLSTADRDMAPEEISAIIASSGPLLLAGMRQVLSASEDITIIGEVDDPEKLTETVSDLRPDLVFTDMQMAAAKRFSVLRHLREENLPCKYVVFASDVDQRVLRVAADYSADGVIMQDSAPKEVLSSLRMIYQGQTLLPEKVQAAINELENNRRLLQELSGREIEVLRLVAEGKSNSQIAEELFITVNTVRFHLANIYQKLNVSNRTEAANYYLRQGLDADGQTKLL